MMTSKNKFILISFFLVFISGCSNMSNQTPQTVTVIDRSEAGQAVIKTKRDPQQTSAIDKLMLDAKQWREQGQYVKAAAVLERALRIKPRNPFIWSQLAELRYSQKQYRQAESLALRSNQYAGNDISLKQSNWALIANARDKQGNKAGSIAARKKSKE